MNSLLARVLPRFDNSLENPRVSLNDPRAWDELFGLNLSDPGVRVTPQVAIGYAPLWRGINLICNAVMKSPFATYRTSGKNRSEIDPKHPAYYMLHWAANEFLSAATWKQVMCYHALFRGNGYSAIWRDGAGRPKEFLPLSPTDTVPVQENGRLWYASKIQDKKRKIPAEDVFHLKGLSYDGLVGHDVLTLLKDELGEGIALRKYVAKFFSNGAATGGVLMIPRGMPENAAKQLKKDWKDYQEGLDNAFRTAVLEDGAKWLATTFDPQRAQMIDARKLNLITISNVLGIAPHKLGDASRLAYNSLDAENETTLDETYDPWLSRYEDEADHKLLSEEEKRNGSHFCAFDRSLLRLPDAKTKADVDDKRVNSGLRTLNEVRAENNEPPLPPEIGDVLRIPTTVTLGPPKENSPAPPAKPSASEEIDPAANRLAAINSAHRALLDDRLARFLAIDREQLGRAAAREKNFVGWLDRWCAGQQEKLALALKPVFGAIEATGSNPGDPAAFARDCYDACRNAWLAACDVPAADLAQNLENSSQDVVPGLLDALADQIFNTAHPPKEE